MKFTYKASDFSKIITSSMNGKKMLDELMIFHGVRLSDPLYSVIDAYDASMPEKRKPLCEDDTDNPIEGLIQDRELTDREIIMNECVDSMEKENYTTVIDGVNKLIATFDKGAYTNLVNQLDRLIAECAYISDTDNKCQEMAKKYDDIITKVKEKFPQIEEQVNGDVEMREYYNLNPLINIEEGYLVTSENGEKYQGVQFKEKLLEICNSQIEHIERARKHYKSAKDKAGIAMTKIAEGRIYRTISVCIYGYSENRLSKCDKYAIKYNKKFLNTVKEAVGDNDYADKYWIGVSRKISLKCKAILKHCFEENTLKRL